jgi:hypothetical protein
LNLRQKRLSNLRMSLQGLEKADSTKTTALILLLLRMKKITSKSLKLIPKTALKSHMEKN